MSYHATGLLFAANVYAIILFFYKKCKLKQHLFPPPIIYYLSTPPLEWGRWSSLPSCCAGTPPLSTLRTPGTCLIGWWLAGLARHWLGARRRTPCSLCTSLDVERVNASQTLLSLKLPYWCLFLILTLMFVIVRSGTTTNAELNYLRSPTNNKKNNHTNVHNNLPTTRPL